MPRTPAPFTQADVKRAVKAVQAAGVPVGGVEIKPDGTIRVLSHAGNPSDNPESALANWKAQHGQGYA